MSTDETQPKEKEVYIEPTKDERDKDNQLFQEEIKAKISNLLSSNGITDYKNGYPIFFPLKVDDIVDAIFIPPNGKDRMIGHMENILPANKVLIIDKINKNIYDTINEKFKSEKTTLDLGGKWADDNVLKYIKGKKKADIQKQLSTYSTTINKNITDEQSSRLLKLKTTYLRPKEKTGAFKYTAEKEKTSTPDQSIFSGILPLPKKNKIKFDDATIIEYKIDTIPIKNPGRITDLQGKLRVKEGVFIKDNFDESNFDKSEIEKQKQELEIKIGNIISYLNEAEVPLLKDKMIKIRDRLIPKFDKLINNIKKLYIYLFITNFQSPNRTLGLNIFRTYIYYNYFKLLQTLWLDRAILSIPMSATNEEKVEINTIKANTAIFPLVKTLLIGCISIFLNTMPNFIGGIALNDDRNIQDQQSFNLNYIVKLSLKLDEDSSPEFPTEDEKANQTWRCGYTILINNMSNTECQWAIPDGGFEEIGKQMELQSKDRLKQIQYERSICKHGDTYKAMLARSVKGGRHKTRKLNNRKLKSRKTKRHRKKTNRRLQKKQRKTHKRH